MSDEQWPSRRRPWTLWGLSALLIGVGALHLWLAADHTLHAGRWRDLGVSFPPLLRAAAAALWGLAFGAAGIALARRRRRVRRWILLLASNYGLYSVLWLSVFARSDAARARIPFVAALALLATALLAWGLSWRRIAGALSAPDAL